MATLSASPRTVRRRALAGTLLALTLLSTAQAGVVLTEQEAPEWTISEWLNGDPGTLADHRGRVVLIHFFQMWCPACNSFTVPLFQRWSELYGSREDVLIVGIHTVFEGHDVQTPDALRSYVRDLGITYPVGVDAYTKRDPEIPVTMKLYQNEGTPQVAIVDKHGKLRFAHFDRFDPYVVEGMIERLLKEIGPQPGKAKPVARANPELSGRYRVTMSQTTKTCGRLIRPMTLDMEVTVIDNRLQARSRQAFVGINDLEVKFDPAAMTFEALLNRSISEQGTQVNVNLRLEGVFRRGSSPMEFEYTFAFDKDADEPERQCKIEGRGKGTRVDPDRRR